MPARDGTPAHGPLPPGSVSLVVPCYQEEAALGPFAGLLPALPADEILFVDDGSTDGTAAGLAALARTDARVRVLRHERNLGVGAAMRTGLSAARGSVCVVYDADRTYPSEDIAALVALVRAGADVAGATPLVAGGGLDGVPPLRRLLTRGAAAVYRRVLGPRGRRVSTFTCAFRAYRSSALRCCLPREDGFAAAAEMLGRALLAGLVVVERPSRLSARTEGTSKLRLGRALWGHGRTLLRLAGLRARPRSPSS